MSDGGICTKLFAFFLCSLGFFIGLNIVSWICAMLVTNTFLPDWRYFSFPAHFWFLGVTPRVIIPFIFVYSWMLLAHLTNNSTIARSLFSFVTIVITLLMIIFVVGSGQLITTLEKILIVRDVVLGLGVPVLLLTAD